MSSTITPRSIRDLLTARASMRHVLSLAAAAGATLALGASGAQAQGTSQSATAGVLQAAPVNLSLLPVNANAPICVSLATCANTGNGANQATVQTNAAAANAKNKSEKEGGGGGGGSVSQTADALAGQVLPINASAIPVNANAPICISLAACSNTGNSANQVIAQSNDATAVAKNSVDQDSKDKGKDKWGNSGDTKGKKEGGGGDSTQSATAAALQALPVNASVLPVNANAPICASVLAPCSNADNVANQVTAQDNVASALAKNVIGD